MSGMGERSHAPFSPSLSSRSPSFPLDSSAHHSHIPNSSLISRGRHYSAPRRPYEEAVGLETLILVKDPPRERLAAVHASRENEEFPLLAHVTSKSEFGLHRAHCQTASIAAARRSPTVEFYTDIYHYYHDRQYTAKNSFNAIPGSKHGIQSTTNDDPLTASMVKKRTSIQAIFVPSFFQPLSPESSPPLSPTTIASRIRALSGSTPSSPYASPSATAQNPLVPSMDKPTRQRSQTFSPLSPRSSPPPSFLLDDDPFANLTSAPSESLKGVVTVQVSNDMPQPPPLPMALPRSPLYATPPKVLATAPSSPNASSSITSFISPPPSPLPRAIAGGRVQARPAHQRPAFKSRPSLPSLHTLARMNVVLTKKVRKGRVGAGLPFEPWDLPSDDESTPPVSASPRQDILRNASFSSVAGPSHAALHVDPATPTSESAPRTIVTSQPLLPSQILALGSIAADVEMILPVATTPQPSSSLSPRHSDAYQVPQPAPVSEAASEGLPVDTEHPVLVDSDEFTHSEVIHPVEPPTDDDEYVEDFLELYHQSSRHGSEEGHVLPSEAIPTATIDPRPVVQDTVWEGPEAQETVSYHNFNQKAGDDEEDPEDLDNIVFADNYNNHSEHTSNEQHESFFTHSDSMLFSSPPSSFSLSRSLSSASHSSFASSDSIERTDHTEDEEGDLAAFSSVLSRTNHAYRHFLDPSLSSLELDMEPEESQDSQLGEFLGTSTSRSSSSRPSLSRTRSSSNGSSDVLYSPTADDYAMLPLQSDPHSQLQFPTISVPPEFASGISRTNISGAELLSRVGHECVIPGEGWTSTLGETGLIGAGFGFGFDKLTLTAEALEENGGGVESESLAAGTDVNLDKLVHLADTATNTPETAADGPQPSSSHVLESEQTLLVQQASPPRAPSQPEFLQEEMPGQLSTGSRPVSVIRATSFAPADAGQSQMANNSRAYTTTSTSRRGNEPAGHTSAGAYRAAYASISSRRYGGQGRGNSDDEDGDEQRRRRRALERGHGGETVVKAPSALEESSEEDTDRYVSASPAPGSSKGNYIARPHLGRSASRSPAVHHSPLPAASSMRPSANFPLSSSSSRYVSEDEDEDDSEDDDVPLAQAFPGALSAQKTIRRQVREEREQRKREKALDMDTDGRRARQTTIRPAGAGAVGGNADLGVSSSRDAAAMAVAAVATSSAPQARQRTVTLPGKVAGPPIFNPQDLARKLQNVQIADLSSPLYAGQQPQSTQMSQNLSRAPSQGVHSSSHHIHSPTYVHHSKSLSRPSGEFQNPVERPYHAPSPVASASTSPALRSRSVREPHAQRHSPFTSPTAESQPPLPNLHHMRSFHRLSERSPSGIDSPRALVTPEEERRASHKNSPPMPPTRGVRDLQHQRSMSLSRRDAGDIIIPTEPVPALPLSLRTSNDEHRRPVKPNPASARVSAEGERPPRTNGQPPPLPAAVNRNVEVTQQRVFVGNLQQFHMVEIGPATTADAVVSLMASQGALTGWAGMGGWMVFEIAQDFGMERPIRSYELLADVQSSWLKDKTVNYFMLKLTPLAAPLARSAIPTSSPTHSGYIECEVKRGKWSKRWVQLKEHGLWISKRDNGKDEVHICSLSNFDVYHATRPHRAPKPFTFTVKSTEKLSLFENTDDYMHNFSCSERDGNIWMEKILIARSYVLHQERHILFGAATSGSSTPATLSAPLSRAATRKNPSAQRPVQPLINLPPFQMSFAQTVPHADVFEPGSLLSKQS